MKKNQKAALFTSLALMGTMIPAGIVSAEETEVKKTSSFSYGDINNDGLKDLTDLTLLSVFLMNRSTLDETQIKAADVDGNGETDIRDLAHMQRFICKENVVLGPQTAKTASGIVNIKDADELCSYAASETSDTAAFKSLYNQVCHLENNYTEYSNSHVYENTAYYLEGNTITINITDESEAQSISKGLDFKIENFGKVASVSSSKIYIYEDSLIVLGNTEVRAENSEYGKPYTFVSVYDLAESADEPSLKDTYLQSGSFTDCYISEAGYLYLVSADSVFKKADPEKFDASEIIPEAGTSEAFHQLKFENIYSAESEKYYADRCTVIGSLDLNSTEKIKQTDAKAVFGYSEFAAFSDDSIYLSSLSDTDENNMNTLLTRFDIENGNITPSVTGCVKGFLSDCAPLYIYEDKVIANTRQHLPVSQNKETSGEEPVYELTVSVLDSEMKTVCEVSKNDLSGEANLIGVKDNTAYYVYDVFQNENIAVDFSDLSSPAFKTHEISDEEAYAGGLLKNGIKLDKDHIMSMEKISGRWVFSEFDISDPGHVKKEGSYTVGHLGSANPTTNYTYNFYETCHAVENKAKVYTDAENKIVTVPVSRSRRVYSEDNDFSVYESNSGEESGYFIFSYADGEFKNIASLGNYSGSRIAAMPESCVCIGDYAYMFNGGYSMKIEKIK